VENYNDINSTTVNGIKNLIEKKNPLNQNLIIFKAKPNISTLLKRRISEMTNYKKSSNGNDIEVVLFEKKIKKSLIY